MRDKPVGSCLDRPLRLTIFPNQYAATKRQIRISAREFVDRISAIVRPSKAALPYVKYGSFGKQLSKKGSLRHTANMLRIDGIEADYDGGEKSIAWAAAKLDDAGIAAIVVATASHRPNAPRYRIFCPTSRALEPVERDCLMARLNGALEGILAPESFALPQSYYFGCVEGQPAPHVEVIEGMAIDLADHLDKGAQGKDGKPWPSQPAKASEPDDDDDNLRAAPDVERIAAALARIPSQDYVKHWLPVSQALHHEFDGSDDGFELFDDWSSRSPNYDPDAVRSTWDSFGSYPGPPVKIGTLYRLAYGKGGRSAPLSEIALIDPATWEGVEPPAREWIWDGRIPQGQATYLTGPGSSGKSLLSQQIATCVALGLPVFGIETQEAISLYLTCEDDATELHRRQVAICENIGTSLPSLSGRLYLASLVGEIGNELATFDAEGRMTVTEAYKRIEAVALETGATFVILDNVAHLFAGNENTRNQTAAFVGLMNRLASTIGGAVMFLGHPNKAGQEYSGSTAWENQVRSRLFLNWGAVDEGTRLPLDPDLRVLAIGKANYGRKGNAIEFRWHHGAFSTAAELGEDEARRIAGGADDAIFLRCLDTLTEQCRRASESPLSRTYAPRLFAAMSEGKAIGRPRLEAAMERLFHDGLIARATVGRENGKDQFGLCRTTEDYEQ